jgi:hypothetical protein
MVHREFAQDVYAKLSLLITDNARTKNGKHEIHMKIPCQITSLLHLTCEVSKAGLKILFKHDS